MQRGLPPASAESDGGGETPGVDFVTATGAGGGREAAELVLDGRRYPLEGEGPWRVGRSPDNEVVIPDRHTSRWHARISRANDGFVVEDLDSANGTFLRGLPLKTGRVESGDKIAFGAASGRLIGDRRVDDAAAPVTVRGPRLPDLPAVDGLRAVAVIAVLLYHAGMPWIPGGFLGVEIFFVISGYLITALLLAERRQRGRIDVGAFWLRRARRLLPALYLLLAVTLAYAVVFLPEEIARLRGDALAAVGYATNWYLVLGEESYFEAVGRPSPLRHLWSLAIEEQFYLLWPLVLAGIAVFWGRLRLRFVLLLAVLAGAVGSLVLMACLYQPGVDPSRLYYGTDTRASGLLFGAALAFVWWPERFRRPGAAAPGARLAPVLLDVLCLAALGGLVLLCLVLSEFDPLLYRGGFAAVDLATVALIAGVIHPRSYLGAGLLGLGPLRWIGVRSYGIYLWHWPVFMVTRPQLDMALEGPELLALRLALTVVLADLSYRLVEMPIRRGALGRSWQALRQSRGARRWHLGALWAGAAGTGAAFSVTLGVALALAQPPEPPSYLASMEEIHTGAPAPAPGTTSRTDAATGAPEADESPAPEGPAAADGDGPLDPATTPVSIIGDSVMLGAAPELRSTFANLRSVDAEAGLQVSTALETLRRRLAQDQLGEIVIVHVGNNGAITDTQFDELMRELSGARAVILINNRVPRAWEEPNNAVLAEGARKHPNVVLADWNAASENRPELFWEDGIHLRPEGERAYAELIVSQLERLEALESP